MDKKLRIIKTEFEGLFVIEPNSFKDSRGSFSRVFCKDELNDIFTEDIQQINHSTTSKKGSVRGLHFQHAPNCEIKMVKCIKGSILDIAVDIREGSPTFLKVFTIELSEQNQKMLYIPKGFAHGFQTLEHDCNIMYLSSNKYTPSHEGALNIKDPLLNIKLPFDIADISKKDNEQEFLNKNFRGIKIKKI